ncbi:uncharacterized protein LOC130725144 [Lotus japonicus]|uniref:uncharacterized protein LOC130725144 n=1 Tax=Lotus japonicus TaxID=34305 RepID=UPI00258BA516|nr:uncharacterized protein LOC130725144 [Lotus japonicus]
MKRKRRVSTPEVTPTPPKRSKSSPVTYKSRQASVKDKGKQKTVKTPSEKKKRNISVDVEDSESDAEADVQDIRPSEKKKFFGSWSKSRQLAILRCELGGKYKPYKSELKQKETGTKKCDSPFRLKERRTSEDGLWRLTVVCGDHNHKPAENLLGHAYVGRLTSEEKEMVGKMVGNKVKPGNMLLASKSANPQNLTTIRQVYNERMAHLRAKSGVDRDPTLDEVVGGRELFNQFPTIVLLDSTYKTNKYRISLLEMVGMTSVGFTHTIGFGYMCNEREPEVTWALQKLRGLILREEDMPKVMVTDRETALMNTVEATFPTSTHLLCQFHIAKCVKANCKLAIQLKEVWDDVGDAWNKFMYSESAEEFNASMHFLRALTGEHSEFMQYVKDTWLSVKHKFVKVEGAHAKLKACIKDSKSGKCAAWAAIHKCTLLQHTKINADFQASIFIREHTFKEKLYDNLCGLVSKEKVRVGKCGCTIRLTTTAAPDESQPVMGLSITTELEVIPKMFEEANVLRIQAIKERLRQIAYQDQTSLYPPPNKLPTKGRPGELKGSTRRLPSKWEHVDNLFQSLKEQLNPS